MKGSMALLIACILVSALVIGCAPKPAEFVTSNLTITPSEVNSEASVTIQVTVTNIGELSGTHEVNLKIDDTIEGTEQVTLDGGASRKVTFTKSKTTAKTYSVSIGSLSDTFVVKPKPAEFVTSNLTINPNEFTSGSKTTIQVTVTNIGELSGNCDVNLKIDDTVEATENITLVGGASQNVTFAISKSIVKTYTVNIGELSGTFVVKSKPTPPPVVSPPPTPPPTFSGWGPVLWGSEFKATPGAKLDYVKGNEMKLSGTTAISYSLTIEGLPKEDVYYFWMKDGASTAEPKRMWQVSIVGNSVQMPNLIFGGFVKGEAFELALVNNDKSRVAFCKIIPAPIEVRQGSHRLWVELKSPDGKVFMAWGEGFEPNEEVNIVSTSDGEIVSGKGKADADGRVMVALLPSVVGKTSGLASITLKGKSGEIKVSYEWGPPALITQ